MLTCRQKMGTIHPIGSEFRQAHTSVLLGVGQHIGQDVKAYFWRTSDNDIDRTIFYPIFKPGKDTSKDCLAIRLRRRSNAR